MKFVSQVQQSKIPWPTQRKFSVEEWLHKSKELIEDERDLRLVQAGIWVSETFQPIRNKVMNSVGWDLKFEQRARYLIALCNRDSTIVQTKIDSIKFPQKFSITFHDEFTYEAINRPNWGSHKTSDVLNSEIDSVDISLHFSPKENSRPVIENNEILKGARQILTYGSIYLATEDCFHRFLWLSWYIDSTSGAWLIKPNDLEGEKIWEASYKRSLDLEFQIYPIIKELWHQRPAMDNIWRNTLRGQPIFEIKRNRKINTISYKGSDTSFPKSPPFKFIIWGMAHKLYNLPLLQQPLPLLKEQTVLDLLRGWLLLCDVAEKISESFPSRDEASEINQIAGIYCPVILRESLIELISYHLKISVEKSVALLDALTLTPHTPNQSLWFRPLLNYSTKQGAGIILTIRPLIAVNIHRVIDHWLVEFGLPMDQRGKLFEQQISAELNQAVKESTCQSDIAFIISKELTSKDSSHEEFDLILLLHDLIVIGEVKCQKLPTSIIERSNYIKTLEEAALQAKRKADWADQNIETLVAALGIGGKRISGKCFPIVLSNQSIGVGLKPANIPVIDLPILRNYLSRPYLSKGLDNSQGFKEIKGKRFYETPKEMADVFKNLCGFPPQIKIFYDLLKEEYINLPLRSDKETLMLQFITDTKLLGEIVDFPVVDLSS